MEEVRLRKREKVRLNEGRVSDIGDWRKKAIEY